MLIGDKKAVLIILAKSNPSEAPSKCCKGFPRSVLSPEADDRPLSFFTSLHHTEGLQSVSSGQLSLDSCYFSLQVFLSRFTRFLRRRKIGRFPWARAF